MTSVTMVSEVGHWVGGGASRTWRTGSGNVTVSGSVDGTVSVSASGGTSGESYHFTFAAAPGETLGVGTYEDAERTPFRADGRPGIDVYGEGAGCNEVTGEFTVLDVAPDLSTLWLVYEHHCEGGDPTVFGEIRYRQPASESGLLTSPSRISWPDQYPNTSGRTVPVTLANLGADPIVLTSARVEGDPAFSLPHSSCPSTLASGQECTVYVAFRPPAVGTKTGALVVEDAAARSYTVPLDGLGLPGRTSWTMSSEEGDYIGGGEEYAYTPQNAAISGGGTESFASFRVTSGDDWWHADFEADSGGILLPGQTFTGATRYPFNSTANPGLSVGGSGRGCNTLTGSFTVDHAVYEGGVLQEFAVRFEQHCEGQAPALLGSIEWRVGESASPPPPPDEVPPAAVSDVAARPMIGSAELSWVDPLAIDWTRTVVRGATGETAPSTVTDGEPVYEGRAGRVLVDSLTPGVDHSYSLFPVDASGNVGPPRSITLRGSNLTLLAPSSTWYGRRVRLTGVLTHPGSRTGVAGVPVTVYRRGWGRGPWEPLTTVLTQDRGGYVVFTRPVRNTEYTVQFAGSGDHLGAVARAATVGVHRQATIAADRTSTALGSRYKLTGRVRPADAGKVVRLQHRDGEIWRAVAEGHVDENGVVRFTVRARALGRDRHRIYVPAGGGYIATASRPVEVRVVR